VVSRKIRVSSETDEYKVYENVSVEKLKRFVANIDVVQSQLEIDNIQQKILIFGFNFSPNMGKYFKGVILGGLLSAV
jgi:hypothetical protein